jgi:predicted glycoside hydrolase/deacetylase ChbG (UPF0249 family)
MMPDREIIITADDFGADTVINDAIAESLRGGYATHASLLVNMAGFEDACARAHAEGLQDRIGLHLNLTEGQPLSAGMRDCARFSVDGIFRFPKRFTGLVPLSASETLVVEEEVRAQITRAREHGMPLTHLDSHHHFHTELSLGGTVLAVAREMSIPRVRPARNCGRGNRSIRSMRHAGYNRQLTASGLRRVEYFGSIDDVVSLLSARPDVHPFTAEVMIHPAREGDGPVIDGTTVVPLSEKLAELHAAVNRAGYS